MNKEDTINAMKENVDLSKWLAEHLRNKEYQYIGHALRMNWDLKLKFSDKVANEDIVKMYDKGREGGASGGKIIGAGGDRDKKKRPEMGRVAEKYSDYVIVTSDNPRNENQNDIIDDITKGFKYDNYKIEIDRKLSLIHI